MKHKFYLYLSPHSSVQPEDLYTDTPDAQKRLIAGLSISAYDDMSIVNWTPIGTAMVEMSFVDTKTLFMNKVEALKSEIQTIRAEAQVKVDKLSDKLQSLLAITNEVPA